MLYYQGNTIGNNGLKTRGQQAAGFRQGEPVALHPLYRQLLRDRKLYDPRIHAQRGVVIEVLGSDVHVGWDDNRREVLHVTHLQSAWK